MMITVNVIVSLFISSTGHALYSDRGALLSVNQASVAANAKW